MKEEAKEGKKRMEDQEKERKTKCWRRMANGKYRKENENKIKHVDSAALIIGTFVRLVPRDVMDESPSTAAPREKSKKKKKKIIYTCSKEI